MKSKPTPKPLTNPLQILIQKATGAPLADLAMIENIMRDDIFHSTLDWQTSEQLSSAARQAFDLLNENRDMYEFSRTSALAAFNEMRSAEASR